MITYLIGALIIGTLMSTFLTSDSADESDDSPQPPEETNAAPEAEDDSFDAAPHGTPTTLDVLANDSDPDGDDLEISFAGAPEHGTASTTDDWQIAYEPDEGFAGQESFEYVVIDPAGATDTGTVTVDVPRDEYTSGPEDPAAGFNIHIVFEGEWTSDQQQAVIEAADYLSEVVLGDLSETDGVDDIEIVTRMVGDGNTASQLGLGENYGIAQAQQPFRNDPDGTNGNLPYRATMEINADYADPDDPNYYDTVLHEMVHAMGFGDAPVDDSPTGPRFTGDNAILAYNNSFATAAAADPLSETGVPMDRGELIETDDAGGHWDEDFFGSQVMSVGGSPDLVTGTPAASAPALSDITLAYLEDIGYDTVWDDVNSETDRTSGDVPAPTPPAPPTGEDTCPGGFVIIDGQRVFCSVQ